MKKKTLKNPSTESLKKIAKKIKKERKISHAEAPQIAAEEQGFRHLREAKLNLPSKANHINPAIFRSLEFFNIRSGDEPTYFRILPMDIPGFEANPISFHHNLVQASIGQTIGMNPMIACLGENCPACEEAKAFREKHRDMKTTQDFFSLDKSSSKRVFLLVWPLERDANDSFKYAGDAPRILSYRFTGEHSTEHANYNNLLALIKECRDSGITADDHEDGIIIEAFKGKALVKDMYHDSSSTMTVPATYHQPAYTSGSVKTRSVISMPLPKGWKKTLEGVSKAVLTLSSDEMAKMIQLDARLWPLEDNQLPVPRLFERVLQMKTTFDAELGKETNGSYLAELHASITQRWKKIESVRFQLPEFLEIGGEFAYFMKRALQERKWEKREKEVLQKLNAAAESSST